MSGFVDKAKIFVAEKVAGIPKPEGTLTGVELKNVSRDGLNLNGKVSVKNPYSAPIPICEIAYTLKSLDSVIASGNIPDPGSLAASTETILDVPVKVPHSILVSLAKDIATDWDIDYELQVSLIIDLPVIGDITIPLSTKGELKLPTFRDLF